MGNVPTKVLVLGLDGAGKTAVVQYLASKGVVNESTQPTTAYNVKDIKYKGVNLGLWDVAGKESLRSLWRHYYEGTDAIVWVVDSHDQARLQESVSTLKRLVLDEPEMKNPVILLLANKQDLPGALGKTDVAKAFEEILGKRAWYCEACSITSYKGVKNAFDWLSKQLKDRKKHK